MKIVDIDNTKGDIKLLALAVRALIDTHPDKAAFSSRFQEFARNPALAGKYSADIGQDRSVWLLSMLLGADPQSPESPE